MMKNYMAAKYDNTEFYRAEVEPLMKQVFDLCEKQGIPMMAAFVTANNEDTYNIAKAAHFNGPDKVPAEMAVAFRIIAANDAGEAAQECIQGAAMIMSVVPTKEEHDAAKKDAAPVARVMM